MDQSLLWEFDPFLPHLNQLSQHRKPFQINSSGKCNMRQFIKHTMLRTDWLIQWIRYNDFCIFQCFFHLFFPTDPSVLSAKQTFCFFQRAEYFHRTAIFLFDPCCQRFHGHRFSDQSHFLLSACRFRLLYFFSRCRISVSLLGNSTCVLKFIR